MNKVLKLIVDDFTEKNVSAEYKVIQHEYCGIERPFIETLSPEQKKEYFKLESLRGELNDQLFSDFARYLFEHLKAF